MKNFMLKGWAGLVVLAMVAMVTMVSCDEDEPENPVLVEDGLYIKGGSTALEGLDIKGLLSMTRNEVVQEDRPELMEIYIAISGGGEGFHISNVVGGEETIWGPGSDFAEVSAEEKDNEEPGMGLWKGSYTESETPFTVPTDGLYHIMIDTELGKMAIAKVVWGAIGAATPGGWSGSTNLEAAFDLEMMDFTGTEIAMKKGDFKFRYSDGWKVILDTALVINADKKGVKVNTNFGGAVDALVPGGNNINNDVTGFYTVSMKWELGKATVATLTRTGDLPSTDYSTYEMGFVGSGVSVDGVAHNWDSTIEKVLPTADGTVYTWTWTGIEVNTEGAFKIRQGDNWEGLILGYPQVTMAGSKASEIEEAASDGNFQGTVAATYDITLSVDGTVDDFTLTVEPAAK